MRKLTTYKLYNESVRDKMTAFSIESIKDRISHMTMDELYNLLWNTALYEDEDALKLYLENGADINIKSNRSETLLMDFVRTNDYVIVKMLLRLGADPNIGNDNGYTALVIASLNNTVILVELLMTSDKFNPKVHDQLNVALKFAKDRHEYVEEMLKSYKKRTLNESIRDLMTPKSEDDIKNILSEYNIVDKVKNIFRYKLQHYYTEEELKNVIKSALEYMSFAEQTQFAIDNNIPWIIEDLYKDGYFDYESIARETILDAFKKGNIDIIKILLEKGVDVNYINTTTVGKYLSPEKKKELRKLLHDYKWERSTLDESVGNTSIRDMMTPKSREEVERILRKYLEKAHLWNECEGPVPKDIMFNISEAIDTPMDKIYCLHVDDISDKVYYFIAEAVFSGGYDAKEVLDIRYYDQIIKHTVVFNCFENVKFAYDGRMSKGEDLLGSASVFLFDKENLENLILKYESYLYQNVEDINESLRDMMTPKSEKEIKAAIDKISINKQLEFFHSNPSVISYMTGDYRKNLIDKVPPFNLLIDIQFFKLKDVFTKEELKGLVNSISRFQRWFFVEGLKIQDFYTNEELEKMKNNSGK